MHASPIGYQPKSSLGFKVLHFNLECTDNRRESRTAVSRGNTVTAKTAMSDQGVAV